MVDWSSDESVLLLNPRLPEINPGEIQKKLPMSGEFRAHVWLATSGTTAKSSSEIKYAALSKQAMLNSAEEVNKFLKSNSRDIWINPLPLFHVGGLSILARCALSGAKCVPCEKWNPSEFANLAIRTKATITSLVPAQVHDLVHAKIPAPPSLRAVIVGGGRLSEELFSRCMQLKWPVLGSYGMTEACSQIATADPETVFTKNSLSLRLLPHLQVGINSQGLILIKGSSLLTIYAQISEGSCELFDPKERGWLTTADYGIYNSPFLAVTGRSVDRLKIGGESVDLHRLDRILEQVKLEIGSNQDAALVPIPDQRLEFVVHMAIAGKRDADTDLLIAAYQRRVMPFEKVRQVHEVASIPRSPLNKLLRGRLIEMLDSRNRLS